MSIHQRHIWPGPNTCRYDYLGEGTGFGRNRNTPIPPDATDEMYMHVMKGHIFPEIKRYDPDFIIIAAGLDALDGDPYGFQELTPGWYGWCIAEFLKLGKPIVLNMEGGYNPVESGAAIREILNAFRGHSSDSFPVSGNGGIPSETGIRLDTITETFLKYCETVQKYQDASLKNGSALSLQVPRPVPQTECESTVPTRLVLKIQRPQDVQRKIHKSRDAILIFKGLGAKTGVEFEVGESTHPEEETIEQYLNDSLMHLNERFLFMPPGPARAKIEQLLENIKQMRKADFQYVVEVQDKTGQSSFEKISGGAAIQQHSVSKDRSGTREVKYRYTNR